MDLRTFLIFTNVEFDGDCFVLILAQSRCWVDDGCHVEMEHPPDDYIGQFRQHSEQYGVRCCSKTECITKVSCLSQGVTHSKALAICARQGMKVCSKEELLSEMCCNSGGQCNNLPVWTRTCEFPGIMHHHCRIPVLPTNMFFRRSVFISHIGTIKGMKAQK